MRAPEFCATDYGCVYVPLDAEHMVRTYRIPNDCVSVVGCPDLIELEHITGRGFAVEEFTREKTAIYIETVLLDPINLFWKNEYVFYLQEIVEKLNGEGLDVFVKCHPTSLRNGVEDSLKAAGIKTLSKDAFYSMLIETSLVLTERSSLAFSAIVSKCPLG